MTNKSSLAAITFDTVGHATRMPSSDSFQLSFFILGSLRQKGFLWVFLGCHWQLRYRDLYYRYCKDYLCSVDDYNKDNLAILQGPDQEYTIYCLKMVIQFGAKGAKHLFWG